MESKGLLGWDRQSSNFTCKVISKALIYNHMVVDSKNLKKSDDLFHALADSTRRSIIRHTFEREYSVSDLARFYPMSFAAVQKHVAILERVELVTKRRSGREQLVRGNVFAVREALELLEQIEEVWRGRIDRMDQILTEDTREGETK